VDELWGDPEDPQKIAAYVAKYATKTTDGSTALARRFVNRRQIERVKLTPHARRFVLCAWDLAERDGLEHLRLRHHAHAFGFTGQLITKSQGYSTTFTALRGARALYRAAEDGGDEVVGSFAFAGRGYSDPRGEALAEFLHASAVSARRDARDRRVATAKESDRARESLRESRIHSRNQSRDHSREGPSDEADPQ
jgi:hypothetical protein